MEKIVRPIIPKASKLNQMIANKFSNKNDSLTPIANEIRKLLVDHPDVYADMTALKKLIGNNMMHEMCGSCISISSATSSVDMHTLTSLVRIKIMKYHLPTMK